MPTIVANKYSAAIELISSQLTQGAKASNELLEVNADGSIRTQNFREKLANLGARFTRTFDARKEGKDAAVAIALQKLAHSALTGSDYFDKAAVQQHESNPVLNRFHNALQNLTQKPLQRNVSVSDTSNRQVRADSISDLAQQSKRVDSANATSQTNPTKASKVRASASGKSDAVLERQLPTLRSSIPDFIGESIFGSQEERTTPKSARTPRGTSWNHEFSIGESSAGKQLQGISLSANRDQQTLDITKPVVLFFGGSGERVEPAAYGAAAAYGPDQGVNFVAVNYRGFGDSSAATPSPKSIADDGKAAYQYLRDLGFPPENIILRGYSLGASVAARLHALSEIKGEKLGGVIYDRPITSIQEAAEGASGSSLQGLAAKLLVGSLGVSSNLKALDHLIGRSERLTKVLVIADDGTSPQNNFLGPASKKLAVEYGLRLTESNGNHFNHERANLASKSLLS
jgi:pimeloyl-ACP methyl ester carboxylesterase